MAVLDGKVAIVTGAGQGVGRGIARALAREGALLIIAEIREDAGRIVEDEIRQAGGRARFIPCDVGDEQSVTRCVSDTCAVEGGVDILINNAVFPPPAVPLEQVQSSDWQSSLNVSLVGSFQMMKCAFPSMKARGGGRIVNLGSMAGYEGWENQVVYAATKEAIRALTKVAAREWGKYGITVNTVCPFANSPGWIDYARDYPELAEHQLSRTPIGRVGDCEEDVGRSVVFLCSPDAAFITGHTLPVDGGCAFTA